MSNVTSVTSCLARDVWGLGGARQSEAGDWQLRQTLKKVHLDCVL